MPEKLETRTNDEVSERLDDDGAPPRIHSEARRSRLRTLVARIDRTVPGVMLQVAWHELVETLDLGSEPVTIGCPQCGAIVMRDATRCGHCWRYLNH